MTEQIKRNTIRKRKIAKIAKIFICIMVVLTFLSKTIINMTLPKVNTSTISYGEVNREIDGTGEIVVKESFKYFTRLNLPVNDVKVNVGDRVKKGDQLIILDNQEIIEQIAEQKYLLNVSENNLKKLLLEKKDLEEEDFLSLKHEILELETQILIVNALDELTPKIDKDKMLAEFEEKMKELEKKEASKERNIKKIDIEINNQQLGIENMKRKIEKLNSQIKQCEIRAKANGIVSEINFSLYETKPVYIIDEIDKGYQVVLNLSDEYREIIKKGQEAIIKNIDDDINKSNGIVSSIEKKKDASQIELIIETDNKEEYNIDSKVDVKIILEGGYYDIVIPNSSICKEENNYYVYILEEEMSALGERYYAVRQDIQIGASNNSVSGIKSGLNMFDTIITNSNKKLKDGMRVVIDD